jgi:ABC-2 type transport system permease protein
MRAISIIYRREMGAYLRSLVGYVVAALGLLVCGILFHALALDDKARLSADVLAYFFQLISFYAMGMGIVLSIRLVAEERQQNTLVLLNTSPVRDVEIIVGKFLAAFTFLSLIILASFYMPLLIKVNGKVSTEQIVVGYIGLLLLGGASLAIGTFASSLTRHQLVAAAVGVVLAFLLGNLWPLAKQLDAPLGDVLSACDMWWVRFRGGFEKGILNLKDVVYYVAITYFFLLLATKTMEAKRWQ